jgi:hypothetical protein
MMIGMFYVPVWCGGELLPRALFRVCVERLCGFMSGLELK